eukprot:UN12882
MIMRVKMPPSNLLQYVSNYKILSCFSKCEILCIFIPNLVKPGRNEYFKNLMQNSLRNPVKTPLKIRSKYFQKILLILQNPNFVKNSTTTKKRRENARF